MLEWMIMPLRRYADFKGRTRRMEYWSYMLLNLIVAGVVLGLRFGTGDFMAEMGNIDATNPLAIYGWMFGGVGILLALWALATFIPNIAVTVRRLHDRDMSGWWYLGIVVLSMIPLIGIIASIGFLVLMFLPGTPGPNRFGPDPKNPAADTDVFS